ncbi:hypothetical protein MBLNU13_g04957t1 [Cladosporium sp. NU13]
MQAFSCLYVLSFATLLSVTTGYRAQLSGYYGYDANNPSQLQPVGEISWPSMVVYNGSRVRLLHSPIYAREQIPLTAEDLGVDSQTWKIAGLIDNSEAFEGPYGMFFVSTSPSTASRWVHPAPSLTIGLAALMSSSPRRDPATALNNSIDFWADARSFTDTNTFYFNGSPSLVDAHWNNGTVLDRLPIERTGRCVSEDAYQWGFPSLLLRTFCSATIAFAIVLIPAADRHILYLAEELKAGFGRDLKDNPPSPKALRKEVESQKQGLRLDVDELPMSRW